VSSVVWPDHNILLWVYGCVVGCAEAALWYALILMLPLKSAGNYETGVNLQKNSQLVQFLHSIYYESSHIACSLPNGYMNNWQLLCAHIASLCDKCSNIQR
jgi:type IV secretory pathway component VirB8